MLEEINIEGQTLASSVNRWCVGAIGQVHRGITAEGSGNPAFLDSHEDS
jgi:hypothetical protein